MEKGIVFSPEALSKGLREIYDGLDVKNVIERFIFEETLRLFNEATAKGIADADDRSAVTDEFIEQLRTNNAVFSAFRTHRMQNDVARQLIDETGKLKPFDRWMRDIQGMTSHYVRNWLQTEYSTAVIRAHQAADWKYFEQEADVLPNLQWMPTTSIEQDPLHRQYWEKRLTLPVGHPFWEEHRPGDRWNCKCSLKQTDEPANDEKQTDEPANDEVIKDFYPIPKQPGLDNNPGKDGKIFSDSHPYIAHAYPGAKEAVKTVTMKKELENSIRQVSKEYPVGKVFNLGKLDKSIIDFARSKGIRLISDDLLVSDHRLGHALRTSKANLGKAVSPEHLSDALTMLDNMEVYWDSRLDSLWYVETIGETTYKYVFKLNERIKINKHRVVSNTFVTAGIIQRVNLNMTELTKIR